MTLTLELVRHMADLARLDLNDNEIVEYVRQLSAILEYANRLQAIDTSGILPTSSVLPPATTMRDDEPVQPSDQNVLLANAPKINAGFYQVPYVFE